MTPREQLFALLNGDGLPRPPVWLLFPYHRTGYYVDVRNHPQYRKIHDACLDRAVILNRRNLHVPVFTDAVSVQTTTEKNGESVIDRTQYHFQKNVLESVVQVRPTRKVIKKLLANEEDIDHLLGMPLLNDGAEISRHLDKQLKPYHTEKAEFPKRYGAMMLDLGEPIGWLYQNADLNEFPVWSLTIPQKIEQFLNRRMEAYRHIYQYCLDRQLASVYFLVGSELASPPMVRRDTFQKWIVPFAQALIDMIHHGGCYAIQHYHGQIKEILPDFLTMAPDALHTIEAPPVGNCTLSEAFDCVQDNIALIGNLQYDELRSSTPEEIIKKVQAICHEVNGRRFILSPSAGPFDEAPDKRLIDNYQAFLGAGLA